MPVVALDAATVGTSDQWALTAGANKVVAVNSPDDDDTTRISETTADENESYYLENPPAMGSIQSVTHRMRTRDNSGDANKVVHSGRFFIGANQTIGTSRNTGNTYTTWTEALARPGGGNWQVTDFTNPEGATRVQVVIKAISFDAVIAISCTTLNADVDYQAPGGGYFVFGLGFSWIPPLIAVASHNLSNLDIATILRNLKIRPNGPEEFAVIQAEFLRRPRFAFLGVH